MNPLGRIVYLYDAATQRFVPQEVESIGPIIPVDPSGILVGALNYAFNLTDDEWHRLLETAFGVGLDVGVGQSLAVNAAAMYYDRTAADNTTRIGEVQNPGSALTTPQAAICTLSFTTLADGAGGWALQHTANAETLGDTNSENAALATGPGEWTITHAPAADTVATATRAAGTGGIRHVLKSICADINAVAAITAPVSIVVRDGASGAGTILWQRRLTAPAGTTASIELADLNIVGSPDTALTVETVASPGATNFATVSASGYSTSAVAPIDEFVIQAGYFDDEGIDDFGYATADAFQGVIGSLVSGDPDAQLGTDVFVSLLNVVEPGVNDIRVFIRNAAAAGTGPAQTIFTSITIETDQGTLNLDTATADVFSDAEGSGQSYWGWETGEGATPVFTEGLQYDVTLTV